MDSFAAFETDVICSPVRETPPAKALPLDVWWQPYVCAMWPGHGRHWVQTGPERRGPGVLYPLKKFKVAVYMDSLNHAISTSGTFLNG